MPRHTSEAFVEFLGDVAATSPRRDIHVIVDNLSAHKTKRVQALLDAHPRVHLHFTATYASWLNQVELWFNKIERDSARPWDLHLAPGPDPKDPTLHQPVQRAPEADPLDLQQSGASNYYRFSC